MRVDEFVLKHINFLSGRTKLAHAAEENEMEKSNGNK